MEPGRLVFRNEFVGLLFKILQIFKWLTAEGFDIALLGLFAKQASEVDLEKYEELADWYHLEIQRVLDSFHAHLLHQDQLW